MALAFLAMTAWAAATALNQDEAGGEDRTSGAKILEAGQEVAADESGMLWDFKRMGGVGFGRFHIG